MGRSDAEGAEYQPYQSISGYHDEHPDEAEENLFLAFIALGIRCLRRDELEYPPEEDKESYGESQDDNGIDNHLADISEKFIDRHLP